MTLRLVTWNINSVRLRIDNVCRLLAEWAPDICACRRPRPRTSFSRARRSRQLGYRHMLVHGMKGYNGVAILSRSPFAIAGTRAWCARADCRHAIVELPGGIELHNIYVPAGGDIPDPEANPKFAHKLQFLDELTAWFAAERGDGPADDRGRRSQHRAARNRCVVAQAAADRRQPHAGRGRAARRAAAGRRLCRCGAAFRAAGGAALHLVELSRPRLGGFRPRPPPRSHLGDAAAGRRARAGRVYRDSRGWGKASDHVPVMVTIGS